MTRLKAALDTAPGRGLSVRTRPDGAPMDYRYMARGIEKQRTRLDLMACDPCA